LTKKTSFSLCRDLNGNPWLFYDTFGGKFDLIFQNVVKFGAAFLGSAKQQKKSKIKLLIKYLNDYTSI